LAAVKFTNHDNKRTPSTLSICGRCISRTTRTPAAWAAGVLFSLRSHATSELWQRREAHSDSLRVVAQLPQARGSLFLSRPKITRVRVRARTGVRHAANTIEEMQKLLLGYRDNVRVEVETGIAVTAKTVAGMRALPGWPDGLALNIHVDLDPRFSVVRVERAS
jgi:hypothetical protein